MVDQGTRPWLDTLTLIFLCYLNKTDSIFILGSSLIAHRLKMPEEPMSTTLMVDQGICGGIVGQDLFNHNIAFCLSAGLPGLLASTEK
jgi:hypothetical protein